jgi:hypothetical protein
MKNLMKHLVLILFVAMFIGCGSSEDYVSTNTGQPINPLVNQGFRVVFSATELATLFPAPVAPQGNPTLDPSITEFRIFVFDAVGQVVAESTYIPVPGQGLDIILTGLQLANFDVVVTGLDAAGNVVTSVEAQDVTPLPNALKILGAQVFNPLVGFVLPDPNNNGGQGQLNINVSVTEVQGEYEASWDGANARSVSAIPVELVNALANDPTNQTLQTRLATEALTITAASTDALSSPLVLTTNQTIPGVIINNSFAGFTGVEYRVTVDRLNGDTGFVDIVLTARN